MRWLMTTLWGKAVLPNASWPEHVEELRSKVKLNNPRLVYDENDGSINAVSQSDDVMWEDVHSDCLL